MVGETRCYVIQRRAHVIAAENSPMLLVKIIPLGGPSDSSLTIGLNGSTCGSGFSGESAVELP